MTKQSPLPRALSPTEALEIAGKVRPLQALVVLLGYFASLRPEETYGLAKSDFITGERAVRDSKTYKRLAEKNCGTKLAVAISKTRTVERGQEDLVKTHYAAGVVTVWNSAAARQIAAIVRALPDGYLFGDTLRRILDADYLEHVKPLTGMFAYDLRRASGLYLGREVGLDPFLLQDHFRHATITTTMLYTRRPADTQETADTQDFDDVG